MGIERIKAAHELPIRLLTPGEIAALPEEDEQPEQPGGSGAEPMPGEFFEIPDDGQLPELAPESSYQGNPEAYESVEPL